MANIKDVVAASKQGDGLVEIPGFPLGINNIQPTHQIDSDALRDAVNIDLYDDGKLRRRNGYTLVAALASAHSGWSDQKNPNPDAMYYVDGTTMYKAAEVGGSLALAAVVTGLTAGRKVAYLFLHGDVFWSNGIVSGRINSAGVNQPWGIPTPSNTSTLTAGIAGGLDAGVYQVVITHRNASGEESGATIAKSVTVATNGSIAISALPVSTNATQTVIYCTPANGDVFYKVAVISDATATHTITTMAAATTSLKTQFLAPMLPCDRLAHLGGVIYGACESIVYRTEPMRYGLHDTKMSRYPFPEKITEILAVPDGLYVCSDKTYFLSNVGTPEVSQRAVLPYGAIKGLGAYLPGSMDVVWFSPFGQILASAGGQVKALNDATFIPANMSSGASIVRKKQGLRQIINTVQQTGTHELEYIGG